MKIVVIFLFWVPCCWATVKSPSTIVKNKNYVPDNRTMPPVQTLRYTPPILDDGRKNFLEQWGTFPTKLDHFAFNSPTFNLRYLYNNQFARPNGPIVILVGGEWNITRGFLSAGSAFEIGRENNGAMFYLEHRYYGESIPPTSLTDSFVFLSSRQAVEDIISFYNWLRKSEYFAKSKLVLVGCSYAASLATFTKQTHPDLVTAVYSTSGPLVATMNMYQYLEVVTSFISKVNQQCLTIIKDAIPKMQELYHTNNGKQKLHSMFSICSSYEYQEPLDYMAFFDQIAAHFAVMVQHNSTSVGTNCHRLVNAQGANSVEKLANYFRNIDIYCKSGTFEHISNHFFYPWLYQQCTEFGWFTTTASNKQIFGSALTSELSYASCRAAFGNLGQSNIELEAKMALTNWKYNVRPGYGAGLKNIVFLYGTDDPWAPLGYNMLPASETTMIQIQGSGHCDDLFIRDGTNENLISARTKAMELIKMWLNQ